MRTTKQGLAVLVIALVTLSFGASAWAAGTALPSPEDIITSLDPKARGDEYSGPVIIYYEVTRAVSRLCPAKTQLADLHFFVRLRHKKDLWAFGGLAEDICYLRISDHEAAFTDFITNTVMPVIEPGGTFAFKAAAELAQDGDGPVTHSADGSRENPFFLMLDATIAVQAP